MVKSVFKFQITVSNRLSWFCILHWSDVHLL